MLVVTLAVAIASLALPAVKEFSRAYRLRVAAGELMMTLEMARSQAVEQNRSVQVIVDATTGTWGVDANFDGQITGSETHSAPPGVTLSTTETITFTSRGELPLGASVDPISLSNGETIKRVNVSPRGRVALE